MTKNKFAKIIKKEWIFHAFILPSIILLIIFHYIPLIQGIVMSFQDFKPALGLYGKQEWVGFENYLYLFQLNEFKEAFITSLIVATSKLVLLLVVPVCFALFLNEVQHKIFRKTVQTMVTFPHFVSWIMLGGILIDILSPSTGSVNLILKKIGIKPVYFLGDGNWFRTTIIVSDVLKEFGYSSIVYLAAISGIDQAQYEAAEVDGIGRFQKMWYITLPNMKMIIVLMMILSIGNILNAGFDQVYNLLNPAILDKGEILDTLIYKVGLSNREYSISTAMNMLKSVISLVLIGTSYYIAYKKANYVIF